MGFGDFLTTTLKGNLITMLNAQLKAVASLFRDQASGDFTNQVRYNSTTKRIEYWNVSAWAVLDLTGVNAGTIAGSAPNAFASASQGSKADAALPATSYTASDVMAKIQTVDGSSSGLDADTVDGVHASTFAVHRGEGNNFIDYAYGVYDPSRGGGWRTSNDLYVLYAATAGTVSPISVSAASYATNYLQVRMTGAGPISAPSVWKTQTSILHANRVDSTGDTSYSDHVNGTALTTTANRFYIDQGVSAGAYSLTTLLQELVTRSHSHRVTSFTYTFDCDCDCCY